MNRISSVLRVASIAIVLGCAAMTLPNSTFAQSQTKQVLKVGYEGYCSVCLVEMKKWVKGKPQHQVTYDNTVYYFPEDAAKQKFLQNPAAYVPALGGDCTVCLAKMGKRVPGSIKFASLHKNRVFLFPEEKQKAMFDAAPDQYANVDLAANGNCVVCSVKMNKQVAGSTEFTAIHNGMRYLFPEDKTRQMFLQSPAEFAKAQVTASSPVALGGYCSVCLVKMQKWVKGTDEHEVEYDGQRYQFPDNGAKEKFAAAPENFVPALGGDCIVCFAKMGKRVPGTIEFTSLNGGRLFLFPSQKEKAMFDANPAEFANADLAENGNCIVCSAKMGKQVPGNAAFTAIHKGLRYQFPSDKERQMFIQSPEEFVGQSSSPKAMKTSQTEPAQTQTAQQTVSIQGKTACAACSYGVTPIGAPNELGLAVIGPSGKIFVIEESHTRWPELYKARFDGKQVEVSGHILKSQGNIVWVQPTELSTL